MRVRADIMVQEPLVRYVTISSAKTKTIETYVVMYESLPYYCYSCGILGHSSMLCPNPGTRDVNRDLPYAAKKLCVMEVLSRKSSGSKSGNNFSYSSFDPRNRANSATSDDARPANNSGKYFPQNYEGVGEAERSSPIMNNRSGRGRGRSSSDRSHGRSAVAGDEIFPYQRTKSSMAGQKRKPTKNHVSVHLSDAQPSSSAGILTIVVSDKSGKDVGTSTEECERRPV